MTAESLSQLSAAHQTSGFLKVLVIAVNFPPDAEVGAKRVAGFCRYLREFGIQPVVLTVEDRFHRVLDETVPVPQGVPVVRTSFPNPDRKSTRLNSSHRSTSDAGF